jgi:membrane fusion protein (multidrug efflux system)
MKSSPLRAPLLCLGLVALVGCGKGAGQPPQAPTPQVGVVQARPQAVPLTKDLVGRLSAYRSADVRARVSGVLVKRAYQEGTDVKQGQLLFQIDPAPYRAALNAALATLAQDQASYANYHATAARYRSLRPQGYVSQQDLDNAEANERTAAAAVKQAQANVESARINLGYTSVTSPIDGRAGQQQVTEGALVGTSTADAGASSTLLTTVDQLDPLYVNFTMSAADMEMMRHAQTTGSVVLSDPNKTTVQITLPDGSKYDQDGTLDFSDTTVNPTTGAINLRALVPNPQRRLLPGMYVTLTANLGQRNNVFLIPQQGILRDVTGAYALVVGQDGKVQRKGVTADTTSGTDWVVTGGLATGDQVIVSGVQAVQPGAPAKATPWQPDAAPSPQGSQPSGKQ